ncbi:MAG: YbaB/EbfC family nucleoid-associated protein [Phycisphaeraceae bacterium]|nr:YbaB/EbfC family nucleoid-associated protein [Phycisphaeraceae bacterium]
MANLPQIKQRMEQMQAELARKTVEAEAGAGAVRVTVNGKLEVLSVQLDPAMIATFLGDAAKAEDRQLVEELIASAVNEALRRAQELVKQEMSKAAGGLNLPGLDGLNLPV